jgi:hypothetical protein
MAAVRGISSFLETAEISTMQRSEVWRVLRPLLINLLEQGRNPNQEVASVRPETVAKCSLLFFTTLVSGSILGEGPFET